MVHQLAIVRLSHKFVSFLKKYYGLKNAIPQVSQFALVNSKTKHKNAYNSIIYLVTLMEHNLWTETVQIGDQEVP